MKKLVFFGLGLILATLAQAQTTWRGQAGVITDGSLPQEGYYAASNEFPRNTILLVENLKTRETLKVRILKRAPSVLDSNFIFLSPQAALELDIGTGDNALVSVQVDASLEGIRSALMEDRPFSLDPEVNPNQTFMDRTGALSLSEAPDTVTPIQTDVLEKTGTDGLGETQNLFLPDFSPSALAAEEIKPQETLVPMVQPLEPAPELSLAPEGYNPDLEADLLAARTPEKRIFLPPRESEIFSAQVTDLSSEHLPVKTDGSSNTGTNTDGNKASGGDPVTAAVVLETSPSVTLAPSEEKTEPNGAVVLLPALAEKTTDKPEKTIIEPVKSEKTEPDVKTEPDTLETTEKTTSPVQPQVLPAAVVSLAPKSASVPSAQNFSAKPGKLQGEVLGEVRFINALQNGGYVQVGGFSDEAALLKALDVVQSHIPLSVLTVGTEKTVFRLVAGPVRKDQVGFLVMHFRSQGYREASVLQSK